MDKIAKKIVAKMTAFDPSIPKRQPMLGALLPGGDGNIGSQND
jgi:hypothetical protein